MENNSSFKIDNIVEELCKQKSYEQVFHSSCSGQKTLSRTKLAEIVEHARAIIFPGYFGRSDLQNKSMSYYIGSLIDELYHSLAEQIRCGYAFIGDQRSIETAEEKSRYFCEKLPEIRELLASDAVAAYEGDPAAKFVGETIFCYPSMLALTNHRIAHELFKLNVPLIPRIISEMAHSETGIDIHPGAEIAEHFFIDHGTGVVIGETCIIGKNVRIYQGVTLGAKSFPKDENGNPIKDIARHPIVEDDVIIYSHATILGRITIGKGSVVGANVWQTENVPAKSVVLK